MKQMISQGVDHHAAPARQRPHQPPTGPARQGMVQGQGGDIDAI